MNLNEFAKEIHANACDKGFWDEPRPFDELCALMISELAEALEEARAGRPMEWYGCAMECIGNGMCEGGKCDFQKGEPCIAKGRKPEGIAVEMADCAIRILDYLGRAECNIDDLLHKAGHLCIDRLTVVFIEAAKEIIRARECDCCGEQAFAFEKLVVALDLIIAWFEANELDFEAIARRKHEYNKTRPRLHGKLF